MGESTKIPCWPSFSPPKILHIDFIDLSKGDSFKGKATFIFHGVQEWHFLEKSYIDYLLGFYPSGAGGGGRLQRRSRAPGTAI